MSSLPSASSSVNGRNGHPTNGNSSSHTDIVTPSTTPSENHDNLPSSSHFVGYVQTPFGNHNEDIVNHLYHAGFQTGLYSDTLLHVHQSVYRLHAIVLSRSPFLAHLMSTTPPSGAQRSIYVNLEREPEVTSEGFNIALGYLYSSVSTRMVRPENARAVLAAASLLGGMDDLCQYAYEACRQSISLDNISSWVEFVDALPAESPSTPEQPPPSVFGTYAQRLRNDVFHFLVVTLPEFLEVRNSTPQDSEHKGRDILLQIYSRVPFDMFKAAVESPGFRVGNDSDQARFKFAKDAIELRKQGVARGNGAEETVVLAFGGGGSFGVHVTRKMRKRALWKVNS